MVWEWRSLGDWDNKKADVVERAIYSIVWVAKMMEGLILCLCLIILVYNYNVQL